MPVQELERTTRARLRLVTQPSHHTYPYSYPSSRPFPFFEIDRSPRLPLQTELFLIAHDDDTGRRHLDHGQLEKGLAAAILLELALTGRVKLGARYDARTGTWVRDPGRITVLKSGAVGDPLTDTALEEIWRSGPTLRVKDFIRRYATAELRERIQGDMIAARVIKRTTRRRFFLFRRETHVPVHDKLSVRARNKVRDLVEDPPSSPNHTDRQAVALACLVTGLGLTRNLYSAKTDPVELHRYLNNFLDHHGDTAVHDVTAALTGTSARH